METLIAQIRRRLRVAFVHHFQVTAIFAGAAAVALYGVAFGLMAAQAWLARWYQSPIEADGTIAGALLLIALIVAAVGESVRRAPPPRMQPPVNLALALPVVARIAPSLLNPRFVGVASMILGGVLLGRELRKK